MGAIESVTCPSGLIVDIRRFKVTDENLLADPKQKRRGAAVSDLLDAITVGVSDYGPYAPVTMRGKDEPGLDWGKVLQGDRMVTLYYNRMATWDPEHTDTRPCKHCKEKVVTVLPLSDFVIKQLPESSMDHVRNGTPITVTLPGCGVDVGFRLLRGEDERKLQNLRKNKKGSLASGYLRFRVVEIDGIKEPEYEAWLTNLDGSDSAYLRAAFDQYDCGVDQTVEFNCDECGHYWEDEVLFDSDFFFPKYRKKIV